MQNPAWILRHNVVWRHARYEDRLFMLVCVCIGDRLRESISITLGQRNLHRFPYAEYLDKRLPTAGSLRHPTSMEFVLSGTRAASPFSNVAHWCHMDSGVVHSTLNSGHFVRLDCVARTLFQNNVHSWWRAWSEYDKKAMINKPRVSKHQASHGSEHSPMMAWNAVALSRDAWVHSLLDGATVRDASFPIDRLSATQTGCRSAATPLTMPCIHHNHTAHSVSTDRSHADRAQPMIMFGRSKLLVPTGRTHAAILRHSHDVVWMSLAP